jgi:hypothetical protein
MTIQTYKAAIVGRLEHNEIVLLADHLTVVAELKQVIKAQDRLLVSYRAGGKPPEWVFDTLAKWNKKEAQDEGDTEM